ncbi:MAG: DUF433 domain-containing protein [Oscillochloridaceae bacterium]|nr:DUF433 domain-containing protein [Chloroflexaceae bacterium]MDW8389488.1 DUF433 domain-containing protein [Oscillochloridaceae bacterium]
MAELTAHRYIDTDARILSGEPIIFGTRTPIRAIVELWRQGVSPESIPGRLPHLTLAQVLNALGYYSLLAYAVGRQKTLFTHNCADFEALAQTYFTEEDCYSGPTPFLNSGCT